MRISDWSSDVCSSDLGRFRPADDRSMLVDHFAPVLPADIGPIHNAKTWEGSRAFSIEYGQRHHNLQRKAACILTTVEVALAHGPVRCVGFCKLGDLPFSETMSYARCHLGQPIENRKMTGG